MMFGVWRCGGLVRVLADSVCLCLVAATVRLIFHGIELVVLFDQKGRTSPESL